jgi:Protein of unknown function (DUF3105)
MVDKPRVKVPKQRVKAPKQRVKAPQQRATPRDSGRDRRLLGIGAAAAGALLGVVAVVALLGLGGGGRPSVEEARSSIQAAGGTLRVADGVPGRHSLGPDDTSPRWNTNPPTSGPHFGFDASGNVGTVVWGAYQEPVQLARVVHNLEHGGIYIFYGDDVRQSVVAQLQAFYDDHERGTVLAPLPTLGDQIALGAWVADGGEENGYLAKLPRFDEEAFSAFFDAFQFRGPERFPEDQLLPGRN